MSPLHGHNSLANIIGLLFYEAVKKYLQVRYAKYGLQRNERSVLAVGTMTRLATW